jgi:hypothetical protein
MNRSLLSLATLAVLSLGIQVFAADKPAGPDTKTPVASNKRI